MYVRYFIHFNYIITSDTHQSTQGTYIHFNIIEAVKQSILKFINKFTQFKKTRCDAPT